VSRRTPITLAVGDLAAGLRAVRHAMARADDRPILAGVCLEGDDDGFRVIASDNYRVAVYELLSGPDALEQSAVAEFGRRVVPRNEVVALLAWLKTFHDIIRVQITVAEPRITFSTAHGSFEARLVNGEYPDWSAIEPPEDRDGSRLKLATRFLADFGRAAGVAGVIQLNLGKPWEPVLIRVLGTPLREIVMPVLDDEGRANMRAARHPEDAA